MNNETYKVLIVEDEIFSAQYLLRILQSLGFKHIFKATNKDEALDIVQDNYINFVFMDINIKGPIDGITCAHLLNKKYFLPIIFTTAYGDSSTIEDASDTNIFGYIIKPFELSDVEATLSIAKKRIQKYMRDPQIKKTDNSGELIELGNNQRYNFTNKTYTINNIPINLTKNEMNILYALCHNIDNNTSYDMLIEFVWKNNNISTSTIRDAISRLKKKAPLLELDNIIGYGYILKRS